MSGGGPCCLDRRSAGVLLHLSSLPGSGPCGQLGPAASRFAEFLAACGVTVWQMLPVGPTAADGSPYQSASVHAGNHRFVSPEPLVAAGWLEPADAALEVDAWLPHAWRRFRVSADAAARRELEDFCRQEAYWLEHAKKIKGVIGNLPLILVGGMKYPQTMERILRSGGADLISLCRPLIREPDLPKEMEAGRKDPAKCGFCNRCLMEVTRKPLRCYNAA